MQMPEESPEILKRLAIECWNPNRQERPDFVDIVERLERSLKDLGRRPTFVTDPIEIQQDALEIEQDTPLYGNSPTLSSETFERHGVM